MVLFFSSVGEPVKTDDELKARLIVMAGIVAALGAGVTTECAGVPSAHRVAHHHPQRRRRQHPGGGGG